MTLVLRLAEASGNDGTRGNRDKNVHFGSYQKHIQAKTPSSYISVMFY